MKTFVVTAILLFAGLLCLGATSAWADEVNWSPERAPKDPSYGDYLLEQAVANVTPLLKRGSPEVDRQGRWFVTDERIALVYYYSGFGAKSKTGVGVYYLPEDVAVEVWELGESAFPETRFFVSAVADATAWDATKNQNDVFDRGVAWGRATAVAATIKRAAGDRPEVFAEAQLVALDLPEDFQKEENPDLRAAIVVRTEQVTREIPAPGSGVDLTPRVTKLEERVDALEARKGCEGHRPRSAWSIGIGAGALYADAGTEYQIPCFTGHAVVRWGEENKYGIGAVVHYGFDGEEDQQDWAKRAALEAYIHWFKIGLAYQRLEILDPSEHFYWASEGWSAGIGVDLRTGPLGNAPFSPGFGLSGSIYGGKFNCQDRTGLAEDSFKEFGWTGEARVYVEFFPGRW